MSHSSSRAKPDLPSWKRFVGRQLKTHPLLGAGRALGIWVAPGAWVIAEFVLAAGKPSGLVWHQALEYQDHDGLLGQLKQLVKHRMLGGRVASVALSTPEIMTVTQGFDPEKDPSEQGMLPPGISWDEIEWCSHPEGIVALMRRSDVALWRNVLELAGLIPGAIVPAGLRWNGIFDVRGALRGDRAPEGKAEAESAATMPGFIRPTAEEREKEPTTNHEPDIACRLPGGVLTQEYPDGRWDGGVHVPDLGGRRGEDAECVRFGRPLRSEFSWVPSIAAPCLEPVLGERETPGFSLNAEGFRAREALEREHRLWKLLRLGLVGTVGVVGILALLWCVLAGWDGMLEARRNRRRHKVAKVEKLQVRNRAVKQGITRFRGLLSKRTRVAPVLRQLASLPDDSLWFSEVKLTRKDGYKAVIIGHACGEQSISALLAGAEALDNVTGVRMEYSERLSAREVARLTYWRRKRELWRFKVAVSLRE